MIQLNKLTTGYTRDKPLLKDFTYQFDSKIYGILGESGCGKSTLLRTIAGLMYPLDGFILVDGKPLKKAAKNNIYMMHQNYTSFNWMNCIDNVLISKKIQHKKITKKDIQLAENLLNKVGIYEHRNKYPSQLSGGMRQRLALARTIYVKPDIILMDEPLSALDDITRSKMQNLILNLHKETSNTIIMVTHSKEEANKMCDQIINLNNIKEK